MSISVGRPECKRQIASLHDEALKLPRRKLTRLMQVDPTSVGNSMVGPTLLESLSSYVSKITAPMFFRLDSRPYIGSSTLITGPSAKPQMSKPGAPMLELRKAV